MDRDAARWVLVVLVVGVCAPTSAGAQQLDASATSLPELLNREIAARLVGGAGGGTFSVGHAFSGGLLFAVDLGGALQLPIDGAQRLFGFGLGAELGYQTTSGVSFGLRYDDLELSPGDVDHARFEFATFAMRYTFPYLVPAPYVEAAAGFSFVASTGPLGTDGPVVVGPGGALGGGIAIPLGRHAALDVGLRDWVAPANGTLTQVLSLEVGITLTTGGAGRSR